MKQSSAPSVITTPFGDSGSKNTIPQTSSTGATDGLASWSTGFPDSTMTPISAGGIPPHGKDFNGIFYELSQAVQWLQAGGLGVFSQTLANTIGGYSKGALVLGSDGLTIYKSLIDSNTNSPTSSSGSSFWRSIGLADALKTAFTLSLTGDVTGSVSIDGSGDVSLTTSLSTSYSSGSFSNGVWSKIGDVLTQEFYVTKKFGDRIDFPLTYSDVPVVTLTASGYNGQSTTCNISGSPDASGFTVISSYWGSSAMNNAGLNLIQVRASGISS